VDHRSCALVDGIDGDESSGHLGPCISRSPDRLNQKVTTESLSVAVVGNRQAGQKHHPDLVAGESPPIAGRQRLPLNSTHRERVVADGAATVVEQQKRPQQVASLVFGGMIVQPVVKGLHPAVEGAKLVVFCEALDAHSVVKDRSYGQ
jgi:hypothetical protein